MINLISPELKSARRYGKLNVIMLQYAILIAIAIIGLAGLMIYGQITLNTTKSDLESVLDVDRARVAQLEPINKEAQALAGTVDTIGTLLEQEVKFSFVLEEISSILPSGVVLSAITLSQDTSVPIILDISLTSEVRAGVFQQNLIASDLFVGADIISVTRVQGTDYPFTGQVQAYFNPDVPLNSLDDDQEETVSEPLVDEASPFTEAEGGAL